MAFAVEQPSAPEGHRQGRRSAYRSLELPAWPVLCLLWGLPLWWLAGLLPFSAVVVTPVMIFYLVLRGDVRVVPGTLSFVFLAAWMSLGILVIEPGDELGFLIRFTQYVAAAVVLVYVVNAPGAITKDRVLAGLTVMWVSVIAGGYLGLLLPYGRLSLTVGRLLPVGLRQNNYARDLFFPQFAEIQQPYGAVSAFIRPSAPFSYANGWGAAMTLLVPVAVAAALHRGTRRGYVFTLLGLAATLPPAVAANNRGMFVAIGVALLVLALRLAAQGHLGATIGILALGGASVLAMVQLGIVQTLTERSETGRSAEGRSVLYLETFQRTLKSPIIGYGAPRDSLTTEVTVGTQGAVWAVMFCSGFVGLVLLALFLLGAVVRTWKLRSHADMWLNAALVAVCTMSLFYGIDRMLVPVCVVIGVLLRDDFLARFAAGAGRRRREPQDAGESAT